MAIPEKGPDRDRLCGGTERSGGGKRLYQRLYYVRDTNCIRQVQRAAEQALAEIEISDDSDMMNDDDIEPEI